MSFRLRVLGIVSLVAVIAVAATAYLAFWQTSKQVNESAAAGRETVLLIDGELTGYARTHGTWEGIARTLLDLRRRTGQRIRLTTNDDVVVADTDLLEGRAARTVMAAPLLVDARPTPVLPDLWFEPRSASEAALDAIARYRTGIRFAVCMTRAGLAVVTTTGDLGIDQYAAAAKASSEHGDQVRRCEVEARLDPVPAGAAEAVDACADFGKVRRR